jgi:hypothetical protein
MTAGPPPSRLAGNLDLLTRELLRPVRPAAGRTPEEVPDGKR